jgi:putative restriction endonuclease
MLTRCESVSSTTAALNLHSDYEIGCVMLGQPFFFAQDEWLPVPEWQPNIVRGKTYDLTVEPGRNL